MGKTREQVRRGTARLSSNSGYTQGRKLRHRGAVGEGWWNPPALSYQPKAVLEVGGVAARAAGRGHSLLTVLPGDSHFLREVKDEAM